MTVHALALTLDSNHEKSVGQVIGSLYHWERPVALTWYCETPSNFFHRGAHLPFLFQRI